MYSPTIESLVIFLESPTWLTIKVWTHRQEQQIKAVNMSSVSTAKMSLLLEMGFASFGGDAKNVDQNIERYLPFRMDLTGDRQSVISQESVDIFWECVKTNVLPPFVLKTFKGNKELMEILDSRKEQ